MTKFDANVLEAATREREIVLTTTGRKTGTPHHTTMWIFGDGERLFITSSKGLSRDWPRNLIARNRAILRLDGLELPVEARHVTDPTEARAVLGFVDGKYGRVPAGPAEEATFELLPLT
jgi:deazaflavin-dependent oxidoreductase (nitroreductase family)